MTNVERIEAIRGGTEGDQRLDDLKFLNMAFKGNEAAVRLVMRLVHIAHVHDDIVDGDNPKPEDVNAAFWAALIEIPRNPFFAANASDLTAIFASASLSWRISNRLADMKDKQALEIAHVLRMAVPEIAVYCALLIGGPEWAEEVGAEIHLRARREPLSEFLKENGHVLD